jgi:CheY-like chemotaxis protein
MRELLNRTLRGDVQVKTDFPCDLWPVEVDPAELEFVILNLCVNARDAMPCGGVISIQARNAPDIRQGRLSGDFVSLSVVDTGTGMSAEVLERVFEPFYTTKEIGKGSGLGLPQVQGFAEQSGGAVKIDTEVGRGTTVRLLLPRSETAPVVEPAINALDDTTRRRALKGSVLLVEDDDEVAALVTEMLQELGYRVTRTASAMAALGALADDRAIDIVFSDVMMPGSMNGLELAMEVKMRRPGLPVLLTTGYASGTLSESGAEDIRVLQKPYEMQSLDSAMRAALANRSSIESDRN